MSITVVVQFGFAMTPRWSFTSSALISGMTSGTCGSIRNAEDLSIAIASAWHARSGNLSYRRSRREQHRQEEGADTREVMSVYHVQPSLESVHDEQFCTHCRRRAVRLGVVSDLVAHPGLE